MAKVLSDAEVASIVAELSGSRNEVMSAAVTASAKDALCKSWPVVKKVLSLIGSSSNTWVKLAVQVVKTVGDALYKKVCV